MNDNVTEDLAARDACRAIMATASGQRAALLLLARYYDDRDGEADVMSMTDREVLETMREIGGWRR